MGLVTYRNAVNNSMRDRTIILPGEIESQSAYKVKFVPFRGTIQRVFVPIDLKSNSTDPDVREVQERMKELGSSRARPK
jgi:hypothetical protein